VLRKKVWETDNLESFLFLDGESIGREFTSRSLFYGEGLFETFRWKNSFPVFWEDHVERMKNGSQILNIPFPGGGGLKKDVRKAVDKSGIEDAYLKVCLLSKGDLEFNGRANEGSILVIVREYETPKKYVKAHVASFRRSSSSPTLRVKSTNYLENILARREAKRKGQDEAIFLNEKGEVAEGSSANLFWIDQETLCTPELDCGLLPGVTRSLLLSLAPEMDFEVKRGKFSLDDLINSEGAFLTNSLAGIKSITEVDDVKLNNDEDIFSELRVSLFEKLGWRS